MGMKSSTSKNRVTIIPKKRLRYDRFCRRISALLLPAKMLDRLKTAVKILFFSQKTG